MKGLSFQTELKQIPLPLRKRKQLYEVRKMHYKAARHASSLRKAEIRQQFEDNPLPGLDIINPIINI